MWQTKKTGCKIFILILLLFLYIYTVYIYIYIFICICIWIWFRTNRLEIELMSDIGCNIFLISGESRFPADSSLEVSLRHRGFILLVLEHVISSTGIYIYIFIKSTAGYFKHRMTWKWCCIKYLNLRGSIWPPRCIHHWGSQWITPWIYKTYILFNPVYLGQETLVHEKTRRRVISCHCPSNKCA
jgi:hypothetical protein